MACLMVPCILMVLDMAKNGWPGLGVSLEEGTPVMLLLLVPDLAAGGAGAGAGDGALNGAVDGGGVIARGGVLGGGVVVVRAGCLWPGE